LVSALPDVHAETWTVSDKQGRNPELLSPHAAPVGSTARSDSGHRLNSLRTLPWSKDALPDIKLVNGVRLLEAYIVEFLSIRIGAKRTYPQVAARNASPNLQRAWRRAHNGSQTQVCPPLWCRSQITSGALQCTNNSWAYFHRSTGLQKCWVTVSSNITRPLIGKAEVVRRASVRIGGTSKTLSLKIGRRDVRHKNERRCRPIM
jgi:hypothetical protein